MIATQPDTSILADTLTKLLGKTVTISDKEQEVKKDFFSKGFFAIYQNAEQQTVLVAFFHIKLAIIMGSTLAMVPPAGASDDIKREKINDDIMECFEEVCNILVTTINETTDVTCSLKTVELSSSKSELCQKVNKASVLTVDVDGYGAANGCFFAIET